MRCDTSRSGCQPCRQKQLVCLTTDRVTGKSLARGQADRYEIELQHLRDEVAAYRQRFGPLTSEEYKQDGNPPTTSGAKHDAETSESHHPVAPNEWASPKASEVDYVHGGPVNGTTVNIIGEEVDIAGYKCENMDDTDQSRLGLFNASRTSIVNSVFRKQIISDPQLPPREEALEIVRYYFNYLYEYVPIVHKGAFVSLVHKFYDNGNSVSRAEEVQIVMVLATIADQMAVRNHMRGAQQLREFNRRRAFRWLHYGLGFYQDLLLDPSLASMQAMTFILLYFRGLPKPGYSWNITNRVLVRAIDLDYHRNPDRIHLVREQDNALAKELRKRVFWVILTFGITIGTRMGKPAPFRFEQLDVPHPEAVLDTEIYAEGISPNRSGKCEFGGMLHLCKLLPLLTKLYSEVISVRRPARAYIEAVQDLNGSILQWQEDWRTYIANEGSPTELDITTWHMESWTAEYQLVLHHPTLDTSDSVEHHEKCMTTWLSASRQLTGNFLKMVKQYNGADFTWHSTVAYALGFSLTLHYYSCKKSAVSECVLKEMMEDLKRWGFLLHAADVTMGKFL